LAEPSVEQLGVALSRHASSTGEVFPSARGLIEAEEHWSGRLWEVTCLVMDDQETMRYLAGGNQPGEVAACAARWCESGLGLDDMKLIFACGGYDPEPFETLARAGLLQRVLWTDDGTCRAVAGERVGTWVSDTFALSSEPEILAGVQPLLEASGQPTGT
jgi:hypothetical protein